MTNPMKFPDGFVFGGATAAYQVPAEPRPHGTANVPSPAFLAAHCRLPPHPARHF